MGGVDAGTEFDASGFGATQSQPNEVTGTSHDDQDTSSDNSDTDNHAASDSGDAEHSDGQETSPVTTEPDTTTPGDERDAGSSQTTTTEADVTQSDASSALGESTQVAPDAGEHTSSGDGDDATTDESALDASSPSGSSPEADELDASIELDGAVTDAAASPSNTGTGNPGPTTPSPGPTTPPHPTTPPGSDPDVDSGAADAGPDDLSIYCSAVRDQYNVGGGDYTVLGAETSLGQTFTVGVNGRLAAVELRLGPQMVDPEDVRLEVFDNGLSRGSAQLAVSNEAYGPIDASANAGPGTFDVTALRIDVYAGQVLYFEVTLPEQVNDTCEGGICEISEAYCDFDFDCAASLTVGTEQHAPDNQENLYLGGMMFIDGVEYDHNDYFHDRDLQFKTVVLPIVDAPECVELTDASAGDAQASDAAP